MHFSHSSNSDSKLHNAFSPDRPIFKCITWLIREAVGALFIFSGFSKAIDPWGTLFKIEDYLAVLGLDIWPGLVKVGCFALCAVEFLIGVLLCFGTFRRTATWGAAAIMAFMLPLSLWIATTNPVPDCGCFGDAWVISNWATFWKNVGICMGVAWLIFFNRYIGWLVTPALQWIALLVSGIFIIGIEAAGYMYQPLIDFRPYPVGSTISDNAPDVEPEYKFIYEKNGEKKEFSEDADLPDEEAGWIFIDRVPVNPPTVDDLVSIRNEKSMRLWDEEGEEDVTEEILTNEGDYLILVMPDLDKVSIASTWKINSLHDWAETHGVRMFAAVSSSKKGLEDWKNLSMPEYPIYSSEDTVLKELVRGNPGVVFVRNGVIIWKSSLRALNTDDFMSPDTDSDPLSFARDNEKILFNWSGLYLIVMVILIGFSFLSKIKIFRRREITHDDTARHEESSSHDTPAQ